MSRHTPGPWRYVGARIEQDNPPRAALAVIYNVFAQAGRPSEHDDEQAEANGRLIAQAPDLLYYADSAIGALKQIRDGNIDEDGWAFVDELIAEFERVLAKLEGGS